MDCSRFREDLLDVLYGEADPVVAARFAAHRSECSDCRDEVSGFHSVRRDLQAWRVDSQLPRAPRRVMPGLRGLAAAASVVLAFGGGLVLAKTEVRYREGELRLTFGGGPVRKAEGGNADLDRRLAQMEAAHRTEMEAIKGMMLQPAAASTGHAGQDAVLRRFQQMLQESEARQRMMMQAGLVDLAQQVGAQRQTDLYRINAAISALDAKSSAELARFGNAIGDATNILRINDDK